MTDEMKEVQRRLMILESMMKDIYDNTVKEKKRCPICMNEVRLYLPYGEKYRPNAKCPVCGSMERHRALWMYLEKNQGLLVQSQPIKLLHFAPEGVFYNKFSLDVGIDYYPVDYNHDYPGIRKQVDITEIPYETDYFDIIICSHVLEHIQEERKALSEMFRVLKPTGVAFINAPVDKKLVVTLEKEEYNTPELRVQHYGQHDHFRMYGRDYVERLQAGGFVVEEIYPNRDYSEDDIKKYGLLKHEAIYKCTKN